MRVPVAAGTVAPSAALDQMDVEPVEELGFATIELDGPPSPTIGGRVRRALEAYFEHVKHPMYVAFLELWIASRTDPPLPLEQEHARVEHPVGVERHQAHLLSGAMTTGDTHQVAPRLPK